MKNSTLGGVRELSYDPRYARPLGQTAAEIKAEARAQGLADKRGVTFNGVDPHVPKPNRFYLLRFLGLKQA